MKTVIIVLIIIWVLAMIWIMYEASVAPLDPYDVPDRYDNSQGQKEVNDDLVNYDLVNYD